ncbi:MAG: S1/P1 nuclease [Terrimicrobiaceae bacterium]
MRARLFLGLAALACWISNASAWDAFGHMLVCQVAYEHLTPQAKAGVEKSIAAFNAKNGTDYTFVTMGCWMDDIRGKTKEFNTWHYIELPENLEAEPFPVAWQVNALWAIRLCSDIISGKRTDPRVDKDQALVMLSHLVGDVHQPLHASSRNGDAGGNKVVVPNIVDAKVEVFPNWKNLHYFWDTAYRRAFKDGNAGEVYPEPPYSMEDPIPGHTAAQPAAREHSADLQKTYSGEKFPTGGEAEAWVRESHRFGMIEGYQKLPGGENANPVELDQAYVDNAHELARQRVVQAGLRFADLLNQLYR